MKKLLLLAVILVAAALAVNYATTGKVSLLPSSAGSDAERELLALEGRFTAAKRDFAQASRGMALSGMDMTGDIESARAEVRSLLDEVKALSARLEDEDLRRRAERLLGELQAFGSRLS